MKASCSAPQRRAAGKVDDAARAAPRRTLAAAEPGEVLPGAVGARDVRAIRGHV